MGISWHRGRVVAILLALFLGGVGAHKFYMGRPGWGVIYLLCSITFIPSVVALFELFSYLACGEDQWNCCYNAAHLGNTSLVR